MSNSFDWLHDEIILFFSESRSIQLTTLTVILNLHFANKNAVMLDPKMEKTVYTGKNEGKIMDTEVSKLNRLPFTSVFFLFSDF